MQPLYFQISKLESDSFLVQHDEMPQFYDQLHFHPEYQLTLILKGSGTRFIGDSVGAFNPGEVYLLGSNLPHIFRSRIADSSIVESANPDTDLAQSACASISIYFARHSFGGAFFDLAEMTEINKMMQRSANGLLFHKKMKINVQEHFHRLNSEKGMPRMLALFEVLHELSKSKKGEMLSKLAYSKPQKEKDTHAINAVFEFIMQHFHEPIKLEQVSELACMSTTAFCRFFKRRTRTTFTHFVNKVRIGNACRLLLDEQLQVAEIAYASGFQNVSNFNRQFKQIMGNTPGEYRKMIATSSL